jgi:cell division protein FtsB
MAVTRRTERLVKQALMWGATGALALMALLLGLSTWRVYSKMTTAYTERVHAEEERNDLKERTRALAASVEALKTPRGVESQIRERYPVVKPGEVEFVMMDGPKATTVGNATSTTRTLWGRIGQWFGF